MAIAESCDVYFYDLARRLTIDRMYDFLNPYGFGDRTGVDTTNERRGVLPSTRRKREAMAQAWYPGETLSAGIGQGYVLATPRQLAVATSVMASRGERRTPRLLKSINGEELPAPRLPPLEAREEHWLAVHDGMLEVVHGKRGTAKKLAQGIQYMMAGKTGTAQVIGIAQGEVYNEEEVAERHRHHGLFIAFAPAEAPTIAVAIIVENGGGSSAAVLPGDISPRNLEGVLYFAKYIVTWVDEDARAKLLQQLEDEAEGRGGRGGQQLADLEDRLTADINKLSDELNAELEQFKKEREQERETRTAELVEAQQAFANGDMETYASLNAQAFEKADARSGRINDEGFEWLADADQRFGPVFEVIFNGQYYWVPMSRVRALRTEEPTDLRDLVWLPAEIEWINDTKIMVMLPSRYL